MSGKVKCTCGWSWNKSNSSKKDMYICHECGRDNSNNMKNGGWLDSYDKAQDGKDVTPSKDETSFAKDYMSSPAYFDMLKKSSEKSGEDINMLSAMRNINLQNTSVAFPEKNTSSTPGATAESNSVTGEINVYPEAVNSPFLKGIIQHEISHSVDRPIYPGGERVIPKSDIDLISKYSNIDKNFLFTSPEFKDVKYDALRNNYRYISEPTETRARLNDIRYNAKSSKLYDPFTEKVTPEILKKIKNSKTTDAFDDLNSIYNDDQIIDLLNSVSQNKQFQKESFVAKNGGWLDSYADGGTMQEHQDNYNDYNVSAPEGFQGDGYSNVGRNSSPAWGGQFQLGGSVYPVNYVPQAQDGIQSMSSKQKRGTELLIKETENAKKDKHELQTTGRIKNPRSIAYTSKVKKQPELKQDYRNDYEREYDREKGQAREDKKQFRKNVIAPLDVATDIMQLGNFIPEPNSQTIGKIGNVAGMAIDAYQAYDDLSEGNYADAAINAGSVFLPMGLDSKTFRRNSKYLQPGQPLYPFSPQANLPANVMNIPRVNYIEPFTKVKGMTDTSLLANRALLGTLGAETIYDMPEYAMGGSIPGAVGFSYARTQSPAPSNGKYAKKTMASAQNGKEMQYYQQGLDWQPKTISKNGAWLDNYEQEEIIKDDRGQWDHPGEITEIGSNEITMEGVPYDVLGVSDTGDTKLMKPGKKYKFKGKKVTEYPMAKNGVNQQDQKTLQQIDQLTNFTNYNKPQPGGWLNKYN